MTFFKNTSGFTLVEMVLATTIFAVMSVTVLSVYIQTSSLSTRLKATRYLSETSRQITESIAEDVKENGIQETAAIPSSPYPYWNGTTEYSGSGTEILSIGGGSRVYIYGKKTVAGIDPCDDSDKKNLKIHCGLYIVKNNDYINAYNLVDSFIPEEEKKRVKIQHMRFYISGDGNTTERKVTLVAKLILMPRIGIDMNVSESTLDIQTTISERFFKESN